MKERKKETGEGKEKKKKYRRAPCRRVIKKKEQSPRERHDNREGRTMLIL